jgi:hypothetical protein
MPIEVYTSKRVVIDYKINIAINGNPILWDAKDVLETLYAVKNDDVTIDDGPLLKFLINEGAVKSGGNYRWAIPAKPGKCYSTFRDSLETAIEKAENEAKIET